MSRQFTWWRRFHGVVKLPKKYLFKGASELQQRIEFGEYEHRFIKYFLSQTIKQFHQHIPFP